MMGILLGFAIHVKLYPIIFSLPLYLGIESHQHPGVFSNLLFPSWKKFRFVFSCITVWFLLTYISYHLYGWQYIQESFLYHFSRIDTRHNFSVFFYQLYLLSGVPFRFLGLLTSMPQVVVVFVYGLVYGSKHKHVPLAMFAQAYAFVIFNRVVTSQYFLWYLMFLPLLYNKLTLAGSHRLLLALLWVFCQASWFLTAYLLEFKGIMSFMPLFLESIAFFSCNVGTLLVITSNYWKSQHIDKRI